MTFRQEKKILFTKHAQDKFEVLRKYGFEIEEGTIKQALASPSRVD